jgi:hypothetical protein
MRTTVTLDRDVERLLKVEMHRNRQTFKETLNSALRRGLRTKDQPKRKKFVIHSKNMGLRPEFEGMSLNRILDELDAQEYIEHERKLKK